MKKRAFLYIVMAGLLWGTSGIFFHLLSPFGFSPLQMTTMRGTVSAIAMILYALCGQRQLFRTTWKEFLIFASSGVFIFGTATCYYAAIQASSVSTAVILMYTAPVFVLAYSVAFLGEKLTPLKGVAVALMLVGCALVSGIVGGMKFSLAGVVLGLSSGLLYSAYNIVAKIEMSRKLNSLTATLYCFIVMAIVSLTFANPPQMVALTRQNPAVIVPLILGIGIGTCVLPYFFYTLSLRDLPAGTASALGMIEPMSATIFSVVFLNEQLGVASVCGIVLILVAVLMLNKTES